MKTLINGTEASSFVLQTELSGDIRSIARVCEFDLHAKDGVLPVSCELGANVILKNNGEIIFDGFIFKRNMVTDSNIVSVTAFDRGFYLKKNSKSKNYIKITPESATTELGNEFGIKVGSIAATGVPVSRMFFGVDLYSIITTMYDMAGDVSGKRYKLIFVGDTLNVVERGEPSTAVELRRGNNIMYTSVAESAENVINRVVAEDSNGKQIMVKEDSESIAKIGRLQKPITIKNDESIAAKLDTILKERKEEQKVSVDCVGHNNLVSGGAVAITDDAANIKGLFWIESDKHQFKNGLHVCKITIALKEVSEIKRAGK